MINFTAHDLRRHPTVSERIMWNQLKARRMVGLKFRRQHPLGPFIADFVCLSEKIIIELDGPIHENQEFYDQKRDQWLRSRGFTVLRIKNDQLRDNLNEVLEKLRQYFLGRTGIWK